MTTHTDRLLKNVSRWAPDCPKQSTLLLELIPQRISFCETGDHQPNLKGVVHGQEKTWHSPVDAAKEAQEWFNELNLYQTKTLFVYGVGAGHYFKAAQHWLEEDQERRLVFLEDDLEVIYHLFNSEIGVDLLLHPQAFLYFLEKNEKGDFSEKSFASIPAILFLHAYVFSSLSLYKEIKQQAVEDCSKLIGYYKNSNTYQLLERLSYGRQFFANYYRNLLELSDAKFADRLFGKFQGIPAIVCGAGPSLDKNRALLESLGDKALVIAGGSAMNAVNLNGWLPHFGIAVDPNLSQYARLFMNQGYTVPYFFRNRVFPEALRLLHGEHLYVSGSGGYSIARWFENQLGIQGTQLEEGTNVVNFGIALAAAFGCSPIILVGVDMAYTDGRSYASGILPHPILDFNQQPKTRGGKEQVIEKNDINGNPVHTLWKWVQESVWISRFRAGKPELQVVNATEGGIGAEGVANLSLAAAQEKFLQIPFDLDTLIHVKVQESVFEKEVGEDLIVEKMDFLASSLKTCKQLCKTLVQEFHQVLEGLESGKGEDVKLMTDEALAALKQLNQEEGYQAILSRFNEAFLSVYGKEDMEMLYKEQDQRLNQREVHLRRAKMNLKRYRFLKSVCKENLDKIATTLKESRIRKLITEGLSAQAENGKEDAGQDAQTARARVEQQCYEISDTHFKVEDRALGIQFEGELEQSRVVRVSLDKKTDGVDLLNRDPMFTGKVEFADGDDRVVCSHYYQSGQLHGPSRGFFSDGSLACQTIFWEGKKQGKSLFYYRSGSLYAVNSYLEGKREGVQEVFYENGRLKQSSPYSSGMLDGVMSQYFPSRVLKRKVPFVKGKRRGKEIIWNLGGIKEIEIHYHDDTPVGFSRSWHLNGQIAREIFYNDEGKALYVHGWTADGTELPAELLLREDYFDKISKQAGKLAGSLEEVVGHVNHILPELSRGKEKGEADPFASEIQELASEMGRLREMYQTIESFKEKTSEEAKEALWKTPETQKILGKELEQIADRMAEDIGSIEQTLKLMDQLLKHPKDENDRS